MRSTRHAARDVFNNPILIGTITILVMVVAVYLSYIAENGLPFVPTYNVNVQVANAGELVKNADVRVGGARVGQVLTITPEPATRTWPHPYARLGLALQTSLEPLARDTRYQVRLASVLGGQYLEIIPGHAEGPGLPNGGTFTLSTNPRLNHDIPFVDLSTSFQTFGPKTRQGLRAVIHEFGNALAGRGAQFNGAITATRQLIGPLESLLRVLAAPSTRLGAFIKGLAGTTGALAPVAPTLTSLLSDSATTFSALTTPALGDTIEQSPPTETLATNVLTNALPVLRDAATIVQDLKPGAALLPRSLQDFDAILTSATPVFKGVPRVASDLQPAFAAVDALARDPASTNTFKVLGTTDLATLGASTFLGLGAILQTVAPEQFACNVAGLWARNFAGMLSEGSSTGTWMRFAPLIDIPQILGGATKAPDLHVNFYPRENTSECQAANEGYKGAQLVGDPGPTSTVVDNTTPPPGVLERGRKAGLVP